MKKLPCIDCITLPICKSLLSQDIETLKEELIKSSFKYIPVYSSQVLPDARKRQTKDERIQLKCFVYILHKLGPKCSLIKKHTLFNMESVLYMSQEDMSKLIIKIDKRRFKLIKYMLDDLIEDIIYVQDKSSAPELLNTYKTISNTSGSHTHSSFTFP